MIILITIDNIIIERARQSNDSQFWQFGEFPSSLCLNSFATHYIYRRVCVCVCAFARV